MDCELCKYNIRSRMKLRPLSQISRDTGKAILKKLRKDKLYVLKVLLYTAYVFLSAKKALNCIK